MSRANFERSLEHIRVFVGDTHPAVQKYSDEMLIPVIRTVLPILDFDATITDGDEALFDQDLTELQVLEIAARAARQILVGVPDDFSYAHPALKVRRKIGVDRLLKALDAILESIVSGTSGDYGAASYTEVHALAQDSTLFTELLNEARSG